MNPGPNQKLIELFYSQSANYKYFADYIYPDSHAKRSDVLYRERLKFLESILKQIEIKTTPIRILEFGAGNGDFLRYFKENSHFDFVASVVEPNPSMREGLEKNGITIAGRWIGEPIAQKFDLIYGF
jgi:SAM-dependent methyltransferase